MKKILTSLCLVLLLASSCFATTRTARIRTTSPYGIENTLLAIATGASKEISVTKALTTNERDLVGTVKNLGDYLTVWVDGEEVDARVLTNFERVRESFGALTEDLSVKNGAIAFEDSLDLVESAKNFVRIERLLRQFIADEGHIDGSIAYSYAFWYNGTLVKRYTKIEDNHLYLKTTLSGNMQELNWAILEINATEGTTGSTITGTLTANTSIGDRCCLVRKIASGVMDKLMYEKLWEIEGKARGLAVQGEHNLFAAVQQFIVTVSKDGLGYRR